MVTPVYKLDTILTRSGRLWISLYSFFYLDNPTGFILTDKLWRLLHGNILLARSSSLYIDYLSYGIRPSFWRHTNRIKHHIQKQVLTRSQELLQVDHSARFFKISSAITSVFYNSPGIPLQSNQWLFLWLLELDYAEASKTLQSQAYEEGNSWRMPSWNRKSFWELPLSARPEIYYSTLLLQESTMPQLLELQLPVKLDRLKNLIQGYISHYAIIGELLSDQEFKCLPAWAVCSCSWSLVFSSSRLLICCFIL